LAPPPWLKPVFSYEFIWPPPAQPAKNPQKAEVAAGPSPSYQTPEKVGKGVIVEVGVQVGVEVNDSDGVWVAEQVGVSVSVQPAQEVRVMVGVQVNVGTGVFVFGTTVG
jgi:hypothetical protein